MNYKGLKEQTVRENDRIVFISKGVSRKIRVKDFAKNLIQILNESNGESPDFIPEDLFRVERDEDGNIIKVISLYDLQVPPNSIEVGESIKVSDLSQQLGFKTKFDGKQYLIPGYEFDENGSKSLQYKEIDAISSFDLQPLDDVTLDFDTPIEFLITSQQDVIGKRYELKFTSNDDIVFEVFRKSEGNGEDTRLVEELLKKEDLSLNGIQFDLTPIVDFAKGKQYVLKFSSSKSSSITIKGTHFNSSSNYNGVGTANNTVFVPYIKRIEGWTYALKNINPIGEILYMQLNSSQNLNVVSPFVDLDFVEVSNTISGASVSSNFPAYNNIYKGVVTLPPGKYKTSFKVNAESSDRSQKVIVMNISRYTPSVIYYPESTVYEMFRNRNFATISNPDSNYNFLNLTETQTFGIIAARAAASGVINTIPEQSFWKIEKIG